MNRHRTFPGRQQGTASVEAILVMPVLLLIILLLLVSMKLMLLNLHNRVESRRLAWDHALNQADCTQPAREVPQWNGSFGAAPDCDTTAVSPPPGQTLDPTPPMPWPANRWVSATTTARLVAGEFDPLAWRDRHSLDAPEWGQSLVPPLVGHDTYLDSTLDSKVLFVDPPYFPVVSP